MTTTADGGDQATARMHLGETMEALHAGDTAGAMIHAQAAAQAMAIQSYLQKAIQSGKQATNYRLVISQFIEI
jgi:hypothetical protein